MGDVGSCPSDPPGEPGPRLLSVGLHPLEDRVDGLALQGGVLEIEDPRNGLVVDGCDVLVDVLDALRLREDLLQSVERRLLRILRLGRRRGESGMELGAIAVRKQCGKELFLERLAPDSDYVVASRINLAGILQQRGELSEAASELRAAYEALDAARGATDPWTVTARGNLAGERLSQACVFVQ